MTMKARFFLLLTALFLAAAPTPAQEYRATPVTVSREKTRQNGKVYYSHVVLERQTLYSISKAYNVTVEEIYEANPSLHQTGLQKNAILLIPAKDASGRQETVPEPEPEPQPVAAPKPEPEPQPVALPEGEYIEHTVRWFDSMEGIARKYGVTVGDIMAVNGLKEKKLFTKQVLRIPVKKAEPAAQETPAGPETPGIPAPVPADEHKTTVETVKDILEDIKESVTDRIEDLTFQPKEIVDATLLLPLNASGKPKDMYMDFYAGVLMAVRDLEAQGIGTHLHVYDVATGVIPSQAQLAASDLVLGPVDPKDLSLVLERTGGRVPVISPLEQSASGLLPIHDNIVQAPSSAEAQYAGLAAWLSAERAREDRVIVVSQSGAQNAAGSVIINKLRERAETYTTFSYGLREGTGVPARLSDLLARNRTNRIVIASDSEPFVSDVLRNVSILQTRGYEIVLYAPSRIRTFKVDEVHFHNAELHICSAYFIDYTDPRVKQFLLAFRALYNTEPSQFAYQGYDTATCFIRLASLYGKNWMKKLDSGAHKGLHTDFLFNGRQNEGVRRVLYKKDFRTVRVP